LACRACNVYKADQTTGSDEETQTQVRLFDPRSEPWERHFAVDLGSGEILGRTASGLATVASLQMNRPVQLAARLRWKRLGIFP
jgi:hypothetical protein